MLGLRLPELLLILAVVLIVFGAKKLPQLGAGLGHGLKTFRKALSGGQDDEEVKPAPPLDQPPVARPPTPPPN